MKNELNAPTNLVTDARPDLNRIEFSPIGGQDAVYEIWRRHGDTVDWYLHATVREPMLEDAGVTPGQYYEYKVRAVSGDEVSDFSESAVVYGKA